MITFEDIKNNETIKTYITKADESLIALGYTEHSFAHVSRVAKTASYILETMGYSKRDCELAQIAGYLHDIGNIVNRTDHAQSGAIIAFRLLDHMGMDAAEAATIVTAIGNHDKTDVRRSRVRNQDKTTFDIHDRVNYSVKKSEVKINKEKSRIKLKLSIDTRYGSIMDYFEIFMDRMILCRKAAASLGLGFRLIINEQQIL